MSEYKKQRLQGCNCKDQTAHNHHSKQEDHTMDRSIGKLIGSERQDRNDSENSKDVK